MSQIKSKALYPHPFSKAYWKDAALELKDTHMLVVTALLTALRIAMKPLAIPLAPQLSIQTAMLATALGAMIFGPVVAIPAAIISDTIGFILYPTGDYFLPFILTEIASTMIYALCLYRCKVTTTRVMLSRFFICLFVNVVLQQLIFAWWYVYTGSPEKAKNQILGIMGLARILKNLALFPIESVALTLFLRALIPVTNRMGLTYAGADAKQSLKFTKKQIVTLVLLFLVGVGCVFGYLTYYYNTTNLITKSQGTERYDANTAVAQAVADNTQGLEGETVIAIVTKSNKQFLSHEMHYTAICYTVNQEALEAYEIKDCTDNAQKIEAIRAMSKTPAGKAADAGALTQIGTATLTINDKTGQVLTCTLTPAN